MKIVSLACWDSRGNSHPSCADSVISQWGWQVSDKPA